MPFLRGLVLRKIWCSSAVLGMAVGLVQLPALPQQDSPNTPPLDNIYHEAENLPDDADTFPRMGKIEGAEWEQTNCRVAPWDSVVTRFPGSSFIEISRRQVDSSGESWFYNGDLNCWIHDSRIDLL